MSNTQDPTDISDLNDETEFADVKSSLRIAIRYVRTDIKAVLIISNWFFFTSRLNIKLLDISSKSIAIRSKKKLPINKKVVIKLLFADKKIFSIPGIIVRSKETVTIARNKQPTLKYGIKFDRYNDELGDHLLNSQTDWKMK